MSFKQEILKKLDIEDAAAAVAASLGFTPGAGKIDKPAMQRLLELGPFDHQRERDLELYIERAGRDQARQHIVVLDNELPLFRTTVSDVVLRRSPYLKEMINLRNIIRILNDRDVKVSRGQETLSWVQERCLEQLDLAWTPQDLEAIAQDGVIAFRRRTSRDVSTVLRIFADLLQWSPPPPPFRIEGALLWGRTADDGGSGGSRYGPMVIFDQATYTLKYIDQRFDGADSQDLMTFHQIHNGQRKASAQGEDVLSTLPRLVQER